MILVHWPLRVISRIINSIIWRLRLARHRKSRLAQLGYGIALSYIKGFDNHNYAMHTNGEVTVLRKLIGTNIAPTFFDVGANVGEWSMISASIHPQATIHAFELSPITFRLLERNLANNPRIVVHSFGLADRVGDTDFFHYEHMGRTSLWEHPNLDEKRERLVGHLTTGDQFAQEHDIQEIEFMKIDVESAEGLVLQGCSELLLQKRITVIQLEYALCNPRFTLLQLFELFSKHGYWFGKIFPRFVEFRDYHYVYDSEWGSSWLAVDHRRGDLKELLSNDEV